METRCLKIHLSDQIWWLHKAKSFSLKEMSFSFIYIQDFTDFFSLQHNRILETANRIFNHAVGSQSECLPHNHFQTPWREKYLKRHLPYCSSIWCESARGKRKKLVGPGISLEYNIQLISLNKIGEDLTIGLWEAGVKSSRLLQVLENW